MSKKKNFEDLTADELWQLRGEIVLYSIKYADYDNSFNFYPNDICDFFEGYASYLDELQSEGDPAIPALEYDNKENLWGWFNCYEDLSWVRHCKKEEIVTPNSMTFFFKNIFENKS
jgi:hypothetical protein